MYEQDWARAQDLDQSWQPSNPANSELTFRAKLAEAECLTGRDRGIYVELLTQIARAQTAQEKHLEAQATLETAAGILKEQGQLFPPSAQLRWWLESARLQIARRTPSQARSLLSQAWLLSVDAKEDFITVDVAQTMALIEPLKSQEEWLRRAIEVAENSLQEKAKRWLGELEFALGKKLSDLRQFESAQQSFEKAATCYREQGSLRGAYAARLQMGRILRQLSRFSEALQILEDLHQKSSMDQPDGRLFEEIAECLQGLKKNEMAQVYFARAYQELSRKDWANDGLPLRLKRLKDLGKQ